MARMIVEDGGLDAASSLSVLAQRQQEQDASERCEEKGDGKPADDAAIALARHDADQDHEYDPKEHELHRAIPSYLSGVRARCRIARVFPIELAIIGCSQRRYAISGAA